MKVKRISRTCTPKRYVDLPEYLKKYYNNVSYTSNTVKKPYGCNCHHGKSKCVQCRPYKHGIHKETSKDYNEQIKFGLNNYDRY